MGHAVSTRRSRQARKQPEASLLTGETRTWQSVGGKAVRSRPTAGRACLARGVLALLLAVLLLLPPFPALAQQTVRFETVEATGRFPDEIRFSVVVEGDAEIVGLELTYRVTGSPYSSSRWPDFSPGKRVQASFRLDTQVEFYSPGSEFRYYWTTTDAAGRAVESPMQTFRYEDDRFAWQEASTDRVSVYWYAGDEAFGQEVLDTAVRALDRLERDAGVQAEQQIRIYLYGRETDFRAALGPNSPEWIGGQALPPLGLIVAQIAPSDLAYGEVGRMIPHELSHVVLYQATHNPYADNPNWLEEGIAVHNQEVADAAFPVIVEEAAREGRLIPLRALSAGFPSDPDLAVLSYAESNSVVEFILERYGPRGLSALVDVFAEGETADAGVERALGVTLDELEAAWRETLPAAVETPSPGATRTAPLTEEPRPGIPIWVAVISGGTVMFLIALGAIIAGVVIAVRRRRAESTSWQEEGELPPPDQG